MLSMLNGEPTNTNFKVLILSDLGSNSHQDLAHSRLARYQCLTENQQIPILKFSVLSDLGSNSHQNLALKASTLSMLNGEQTNTNFKFDFIRPGLELTPKSSTQG